MILQSMIVIAGYEWWGSGFGNLLPPYHMQSFGLQSNLTPPPFFSFFLLFLFLIVFTKKKKKKARFYAQS